MEACREPFYHKFIVWPSSRLIYLLDSLQNSSQFFISPARNLNWGLFSQTSFYITVYILYAANAKTSQNSMFLTTTCYAFHLTLQAKIVTISQHAIKWEAIEWQLLMITAKQQTKLRRFHAHPTETTSKNPMLLLL